jgi:hypothetical protein
MADNKDELLIRRKRIDYNGEWEYECNVCNEWRPKNKFRGCLTYIDAYGNCLMCSSCRQLRAQQTKELNELKAVNAVLVALGYNPSSKTPVWKQFNKRHGFN